MNAVAMPNRIADRIAGVPTTMTAPVIARLGEAKARLGAVHEALDRLETIAIGGGQRGPACAQNGPAPDQCLEVLADQLNDQVSEVLARLSKLNTVLGG